MARFDSGFLIGLLPAVAFYAANSLWQPRIAIVVALVAVVFVFLRAPRRGILRGFAIISFLTVSSAAAVGIIADSDRAFVAENIVGDAIFALLALGSLAASRPLWGIVIAETSPFVDLVLGRRHRIFFWLTLAFAASNIITGAIRLWLFNELDANDFLIASRVVAWPVNAAFVGATFYVLSRAIRIEFNSGRAQHLLEATSPPAPPAL